MANIPKKFTQEAQDERDQRAREGGSCGRYTFCNSDIPKDRWDAIDWSKKLDIPKH